jgi:hypothetical protein
VLEAKGILPVGFWKEVSHALRVSGLTGILVGLAAAAPAVAQQAVATCTVSGSGGTNPPFGVTANTGGYTFDSQLRCDVSRADGHVSTDIVELASTGTYQNITCGTGRLSSTSNVISAVQTVFETGPPPSSATFWDGLDAKLDYDALFVGGVGQLLFRPSPFNPAPDPGNAQGGGPIDILDPTPNLPPGLNQCITDFLFTGAWAFTVP